MEKHTWSTDLWTWEEGKNERVRCKNERKRVTWKLTIPYVKYIHQRADRRNKNYNPSRSLQN